MEQSFYTQSCRRCRKIAIHMSITAFLIPPLVVPAFTPDTSSAAELASLKTIPVPEPPNLANYVRDRTAAIQLGKALFWDMQVGSDGVQACASCHFHAGADRRTKNQLNPGQNGGDNSFGNNKLNLPVTAKHSGFRPNKNIAGANFPFHDLVNINKSGEPGRNAGNVRSDTNDVMGSQGLARRDFVDIRRGSPVDLGTPVVDPVFKNLRQVTARNTPSVINAVFNFANFWDGRANNIFNGNNPYGPADPAKHAFVNTVDGGLTTKVVRLRQSSLASQAVGPPVNDVEMSWRGRTWHKLGKKMLSLKPLNQQKVDPTDSVLGPLADPTTGLQPEFTYSALIRKAFQPKFWNATQQHLELINPADPGSTLSTVPVAGPAVLADTTQFSQMEANFSLFFGLAVQLYESTLIADDSRLDRFLEGNDTLTSEEKLGMNIYNGIGACSLCHSGPETTDASVFLVQGRNPTTGVVQSLNKNPLATSELLFFFSGAAFRDTPFHNTGIRPGGATAALPTSEDIGRGGDSPFVARIGSNTFPIPLSFGALTMWKSDPVFVGTTVPVPAALSPFIAPFPPGLDPTDTTPQDGRLAVDGAFKTPPLRNIELTGPYMHNGGFSTLRQVVDYYTRGGDFRFTNVDNIDEYITPIGWLVDKTRKDQLVAFLLTMTDQRVKNESDPFDHPELFLAIDGNAPESPTGARDGFIDAAGVVATGFERLPHVGSAGRTAEGLPLLRTFLSPPP